MPRHGLEPLRRKRSCSAYLSKEASTGTVRLKIASRPPARLSRQRSTSVGTMSATRMAPNTGNYGTTTTREVASQGYGDYAKSGTNSIIGWIMLYALTAITGVLILAIWGLPKSRSTPTWARLRSEIDWIGAMIATTSLALLCYCLA